MDFFPGDIIRIEEQITHDNEDVIPFSIIYKEKTPVDEKPTKKEKASKKEGAPKR